MTKKNGTWQQGNSNQIKYPLLWLVPAAPKPITTTRPADGTVVLNYNLTFIVSDIVYADNTNKNVVISDTLQIAGDILAQLNDPAFSDDFWIDPKATLTPFEESKNDDMAVGWVVNTNIQIALLRDRCAIPTTYIPQPLTTLKYN